MTCNDAQQLLPAQVYGDLPAEEAEKIAQHLRACPACRAERAALMNVRSALDATPAPAVHVDVPGLITAAAERNMRRWRRIAVAGAALAASLLIVFCLRLRVTAGNGEIVIAWNPASRRGTQQSWVGERPEASFQTKPPVALAPGSPRIDALEERLQLQQELIRALATDIESRDRQRGNEIQAVRARIDAVQQFAARQWADAERWVNALYVAQFKRPEEKTNP
jgi:anti-sigma factor RsiW